MVIIGQVPGVTWVYIHMNIYVTSYDKNIQLLSETESRCKT